MAYGYSLHGIRLQPPHLLVQPRQLLLRQSGIFGAHLLQVSVRVGVGVGVGVEVGVGLGLGLGLGLGIGLG